MATNPNIALSYQPNVALQRRDPLADAANIQALQANQTKMDDLREFKQLSTRLAAAGRDPDPLALVREMRASGRPDMVEKSFELETRVKALGLEDEAYKALIGGAAAPAIPQTAPAAAPGSFAADVATRRAAMPANALAPAPAAPVNAMAPAPVAPVAPTNAMAPAPAMDPQTQEITRLMGIATRFPTTKAGMQAMKNAELLQKMNNPYVVGGRLVTGGGKELYAAPDKLTDLQSNYEYAKTPAGGNFKGSLADFKVLATPKTTTTINNVAEKAEAGKFGELLVKQYETISNSAGLAIKTLPGIEANLTILNKGLDTGFGTDAKKAGARILGALGVQDAEKFAANAEMFQSNAINALMQKQLEQKGPQTESDAIRLEQIGAQLGKTKDANRFILDFAKEQLRRDIEQRNFYTEWKKGPGRGSFNGAEDAWFAGEGGKSLFDRPALKKYAAGAASAAAQIPTAATPARAAPAAAPIYARNPQTNQRIMSTDGGNTWTPAR